MSRAILLGALAALLGTSLVAALCLGPVHVPLDQTTAVLRGHLTGASTEATPTTDSIVWLLRLPRVVAAALVGAVLAAAGCALQAVVRNPLADPYLIGVSSGASLGAAAVLLGGLSGAISVSVGAFAGALLAVALVLALVAVGGRLHVDRLVLAGIAVSFFLSSVTNLLVTICDRRDAIRSVMFWMLGSLTQVTWSDLPLLTVLTAAVLVFLVVTARRLDALALGDDVAHSLGTSPTRFRGVVAGVVALGVACAVSVSGTIGFVGLVVPHLARPLVGAAHRVAIPASALIGSLLLIWADVLARTVMAPREIPIGVLTGAIGTPLMLVLLRRTRASSI